MVRAAAPSVQVVRAAPSAQPSAPSDSDQHGRGPMIPIYPAKLDSGHTLNVVMQTSTGKKFPPGPTQARFVSKSERF